MSSQAKRVILAFTAILVTLVLFSGKADAAMIGLSDVVLSEDEEVIGQQSHTFIDKDGEVNITLEWLRRPGEFAMTIDYYGFLTQEGPVNFYLDINGTRREFVTMGEELKDRHQRIRILSFHPCIEQDGANGLKPLASGEVVDYLLFRTAPYYPQFGKVDIEMKFFAHDRWDGDGNKNNENYRISFSCPIKAEVQDHF
ncbi:MAG TPA: hypothetical protein PKM25_15025 [Candidatus Ozemobacteraceae bacterium]|nr:hypothetical protein [Candidatus Ozemobacteraceae bacterium]